MKKAILLSVLAVSISMTSVMANCVSSSSDEQQFIKKNYPRVFNKIGMISTVVTGSASVVLGYHAAGFLAAQRYSDLKEFNLLIQDAKNGDGNALSALHEDLQSARPDISKTELANKLIAANDKDLICKNESTIAGRLLRNLIADGSVDAALASGKAIDPANFHGEEL